MNRYLTKTDVLARAIEKRLTSKGLQANVAIQMTLAYMANNLDPLDNSDKAFTHTVEFRYTVLMKDRLLLLQLYGLFGWQLTFYGSEETNPLRTEISLKE